MSYKDRMIAYKKYRAEGEEAARAGLSFNNPYGTNIDEIFARCSFAAGFWGY